MTTMQGGRERHPGVRAGRLATSVFIALALAACASAPPPAAEVEPAPEPGGPMVATYTAEQADEGQRVYTYACAVCHGQTQFTGQMFAMTWMRDPVGALFDQISMAMPQDAPGTLTLDEYAAILAYFLRINGRPAGDRALPSDVEVLNQMSW